jgi:hypothetical protein
MRRRVWWLLASIVVIAISATAQTQNEQLLVKATQGRAFYSVDHLNWRLLKPGVILGSGVALRTDTGSTADLILKNSRTALRMTSDTELEVTKLYAVVVGNEVLADTVLNLKAGSLVGSQRKLAQPSRFDILFAGGAVTIRGTEYNVKANGTVVCISGQVAVSSNSGQSKVLVPAGSQLDSATGKVAPTSSDVLTSVKTDLDAVRASAQAFASPLMAVADKSQGNQSPNHGDGNDNGQGNDHDNGNGGGNGQGNSNGNGQGNGPGPGNGNKQ